VKKTNGRKEQTPAEPTETRKVIIKPVSTRQVRRFLREPLSQRAAVIYFTERDHRPFILDGEGGGISAGGDFRLTNSWKLTKEKLGRIFVITAEEDSGETQEPSYGEE
jgi:hypothetical protein